MIKIQRCSRSSKVYYISGQIRKHRVKSITANQLKEAKLFKTMVQPSGKGPKTARSSCMTRGPSVIENELPPRTFVVDKKLYSKIQRAIIEIRQIRGINAIIRPYDVQINHKNER